MPRFKFLLALLLISCLFFAACADNKDDNKSDESEPAGDDDTSPDNPAYTEPWNAPIDRPLVTILSPQASAFVQSGALLVQGQVVGVAVDRVTINGAAAELSGGSFTGQVMVPADQTVFPIYVNAFAADGVSPMGAARTVVVRGEMAASDQVVADALFVGLGGQALTVISGLLGSALKDLDLMPVLEPLNPIIDNGTIKLEITSAAIGGAQLDAAFLDTGLGFQGYLSDVVFGAKVTLLGALPINMTITVGKFNFQGLADLLVQDGAATVTISNFNLSHENVTTEGALPASVVNLLLNALEGVVESLVTNTLPPALEDILKALSIQTTAIGFNLELDLSTLDIAKGGLVAGLDLNAYVEQPDTSLPWPNGSLSVTGAPPDLLNDRPAEAQDFGLGLSLAENFLNRFLLGAADAKFFNIAINDANAANINLPIALNAGSLALFFPSLGAVDPATAVSLELVPMAPPVALPDDNGGMTLRFPDWRLDIYLNPEGHAPWRAMELSLDVAFTLDINSQNGKLVLRFPSAAFSMLFIDNPLNDDASLAGFIAEWLPDLLAGLLDIVFSNLPIGLPSIAGVDLSMLWSGAAGEANDYWTAYVGMNYTPAL